MYDPVRSGSGQEPTFSAGLGTVDSEASAWPSALAACTSSPTISTQVGSRSLLSEERLWASNGGGGGGEAYMGGALLRDWRSERLFHVLNVLPGRSPDFGNARHSGA